MPNYFLWLVPLFQFGIRHLVIGTTHASALPILVTVGLFAFAEFAYQSPRLLAAPLIYRDALLGVLMAGTIAFASPIMLWGSSGDLTAGWYQLFVGLAI